MKPPYREIETLVSALEQEVSLFTDEAFLKDFNTLFFPKGQTKETELETHKLFLCILPHFITVQTSTPFNMLVRFWYDNLPFYKKLFTRKPPWASRPSFRDSLARFIASVQEVPPKVGGTD